MLHCLHLEVVHYLHYTSLPSRFSIATGLTTVISIQIPDTDPKLRFPTLLLVLVLQLTVVEAV